MDAVRAADADRAAVLLRARDHRAERALEPDEEQRACIADLQRERSVEHVRRRQPVVDPAAFGAELLGDGVDERRDVVVGRELDLRHAFRRRRLRVAADRRDVGRGHGADLGPAVERGQLDVEPACQLALLRPDATHLRAGVAGDH